MKYKQKILLDKYFQIEIFECPIEIILFAASLSADKVVIENFQHYGNIEYSSFLIQYNNKTIIPKIMRYDIDFQISKSDFLDLKTLWNRQGCYAIFHDSDELKFKATNLEEIPRYKALDNFIWDLELAIPGSASNGIGHITSPNKVLFDKIYEHIINYR